MSDSLNPVVRDTKRTCKAVAIDHYPDCEEWQPGLCYRMRSGKPAMLGFCCPGCGQFAAIPVAPLDQKGKDERAWDIVEGSLHSPETLTLAPSIHCVGCCGWHGYLRQGVFAPTYCY